jgi:hypothetical protein
MMGWETPLMEQHAAAICGQGGGHYLNVGFGLGIIDTYIQVGAGMCVEAKGGGGNQEQSRGPSL